MNPIQLLSFQTDDALAAAAAEAWLDAIAATTAAGKDFTVALSGGRVMRKFLAAATALAAARAMDFRQVQFFWADERCVPPDDPESNFRLANEALLQPAAVPAENIHRLLGEHEPAAAAQAATRQLCHVCGTAAGELPALDLVLLGMGEDGHLASIFPDDAASAADVTAVFLPVYDAPKPPPHRISLGYGALAAARTVWVLASGPGKQTALRQSLAAADTTPHAVDLGDAGTRQVEAAGVRRAVRLSSPKSQSSCRMPAPRGPDILPGTSFQTTQIAKSSVLSGTTPLAQLLQRRVMTTIFTDIDCE